MGDGNAMSAALFKAMDKDGSKVRLRVRLRLRLRLSRVSIPRHLSVLL